MKRNTADILKEALALPAEDRAALAESLLASLDAHGHEDAKSGWAAKISRRFTELDAGAVSSTSWPEMRSRLFEWARQRALRRLRNGMDLQWVQGSREQLHRR